MDFPDFKKKSTDGEKASGKARNAAIKAGSTVLIALSLLTSAVFDSPADIIEDQADTHLSNPPIVMDIDEYTGTEIDDEDEDADEKKAEKLGFFTLFRQAVLSLPSPVRILIISPLWLIGTALMTVITFLWNTIFASPLGAFIASFAVGFAVLVGLYAVTAKTLFPDVPLKDILSKKSLITLGAAAVILSGIDAIAPLFWNKYPALSFLVKLVFGAGIISVLTMRVKKFLHDPLAILH